MPPCSLPITSFFVFHSGNAFSKIQTCLLIPLGSHRTVQICNNPKENPPNTSPLEHSLFTAVPMALMPPLAFRSRHNCPPALCHSSGKEPSVCLLSRSCLYHCRTQLTRCAWWTESIPLAPKTASRFRGWRCDGRARFPNLFFT